MIHIIELYIYAIANDYSNCFLNAYKTGVHNTYNITRIFILKSITSNRFPFFQYFRHWWLDPIIGLTTENDINQSKIFPNRAAKNNGLLVHANVLQLLANVNHLLFLCMRIFIYRLSIYISIKMQYACGRRIGLE